MTGQTGPGRQRRGKEPEQSATPADVSGLPSWLAAGPVDSAGWSQGVTPAALLEQALVESQDRGDLAGQADVLSRLAVARYVAGDAEGAGSAASECDRVATLAGDIHSLPWGSLVLSLLAYDRGDIDLALGQAQTALERFRATDDSTHIWRGTMTCMLVTTTLGRLKEAREYCLETIECLEEHGEEEMATALPELAALVLALGHTSEAIVVYSSGLTAAQRLGMTYPPIALERYRARIATARSRLAEAEFDAARREGESLPLIEALDEVRRCVSTGPSRTSLPA
jgi:tetratricopeptide (TPR) repeat protein